MCDFNALATPGVQGLQPYQPGKPVEELEREYGVKNAIKLASNENPLGPSPQVLAALQASCTAEGIARYPDGAGYRLKQALARHYGIAAAGITLGNGSNDVLEIIARTFVTPAQAILFSQHAFAVYPLAAQAIGAAMQITPAKHWGYDLEAMQAQIDARTRLIFIANPNNPTGTWVGKTALRTFLDAVPGNVLVVLDEAYVEYVDDPDYPDALAWLPDYPNLIITRTFSKGYGLAGLRVGYALSSPQLAGLLNRVRQPFNVNSLALKAAEIALADRAHLAKAVALNKAGMQQFVSAFTQLGLRYIPSVGNFICVDTGWPGLEMYEALLRAGVIVRPVVNYGLPTHLRISIGLEQDNARCIEALKKLL